MLAAVERATKTRDVSWHSPRKKNLCNAKLPQNGWEVGKAGNGRSRGKESVKPVPAQHQTPALTGC